MNTSGPPGDLVRAGSSLALPPTDEKSISVRERVLQAAGLSDQRIAELMRRSLSKLEEQLEAKETKFYAYRGVVTDERHVANHSIQHHAAKVLGDMMIQLAALKLKDGDGQPQEVTNIQVNIGDTRERPLSKDLEKDHGVSG